MTILLRFGVTMTMPDPVAKAKWVLQTKRVEEIPALSLKSIADDEGIRYLLKPYPGKWDGALAFNGDKRSILVNTSIDNPARHNFTFAHELGHYFLEHQPNYVKDGQCSIRCSLNDTDTEQKGREAEANRFAVELLMPSERFNLLMTGAELDFALISGLAIEFMVSKQACSYRVIELTYKPCAVIITQNGIIKGCKASKAAKGFFGRMNSIPTDTAAYHAIANKVQQSDFSECDSDKWLARTIPSKKIYECTRGRYGNGFAMTILKW